MSHKKYFIVGYPSSGTTLASVDLLNCFRNTNVPAVLHTIGIAEKIAHYLNSVNESFTLQKIEDEVAINYGTDKFIYVGWLIPKHISAVYNRYKDSATFIFCKTTGDMTLGRFLEKYVSPEELAHITELQQTSINNFIAANGLNLTWKKVSTPFFNNDLTINEDPTSNLEIAILGNL